MWSSACALADEVQRDELEAVSGPFGSYPASFLLTGLVGVERGLKQTHTTECLLATLLLLYKVNAHLSTCFITVLHLLLISFTTISHVTYNLSHLLCQLARCFIIFLYLLDMCTFY